MAAELGPPVELTAREDGEGSVIVLLHGAAGDHRLWNAVFPALAKDHHVLAVDLRGHGRTPAPEGSTFSLAEMENDLLKFLDARGGASVHLVGMSTGALLALRTTLDHPGRVRSLTMVCGAAYIDPHTRSVAERWDDEYHEAGADAFALRILKDLYYPDWIEAHLDYADEVRAGAAKVNLEPALAWSRASLSFDERKRIAQLECPALIIQAMDDALIDASHGRILRQSINGAQIRILAQTGHMVPLERPAETAEAITAFIAGVEAKAAAPGTA